MNCLFNEGCGCKDYCKYFGACLYQVIKLKTPKSRWSRLRTRLFKFSKTGNCNLSNDCASCQQKQCSVKLFVDKCINFVPKVHTHEYFHPVHGRITAFISPMSSGRENRKKHKILMRDGCCQQCGSKENLTIDHIVEASKGGTMALSNLQVLCQPCNQKKSDPNYCKYKKS